MKKKGLNRIAYLVVGIIILLVTIFDLNRVGISVSFETLKGLFYATIGIFLVYLYWHFGGED